MNKELKEVIRHNEASLTASKKDFCAIFDIMFTYGDNVLCEGNDGFRITKYTYSDVKKKIKSAAAGLYDKVGATHSYIALEMENSLEWIVAFWAILMSGNKPYLVNTRYPETLSNAIFKTLNIKYTVCNKESKLNAQAIDVNSLYCNLPCPTKDIFEDEIAFSSSATSMNEVVCFYSGYQVSEQILSFKSIVKQNPRIAKHYKGSLKHLAFLPFYHVFGLFAVYFWFTFFGRTLVFLRDYSAETIIKTCQRHEVTHIFAVPALWHTVEKKINSSLKEMGDKKQKKFSRGVRLMTSLQNISPTFGAFIAKRVMGEVTDKLFGKSVMFCINGGSYLRDSAMELFNAIGYPMHNGYGMSEVGITSVELRTKPKYRNLNSIGKPFDCAEYKIDENGVLLIKGTSLCKRKLVNGTEVLLDGWFNTGDIMHCRDGHYYISGRQSDVVIGENGENINPDTVEQRFNIDGVKMLSVLGLGQKDNEKLSIILQISPYLNREKVNSIIEETYKINNTLPKVSAVGAFYFTYDDLAPPNAVKVSRKQLIKGIADKKINLIGFADIKQSVPTDTEDSALMLQIKEIIADVLGIEVSQIKSDSHIFFDLGGTSIQYFSLLTALADRFSITAEKDEKYCYTPKEICEYIERHL